MYKPPRMVIRKDASMKIDEKVSLEAKQMTGAESDGNRLATDRFVDHVVSKETE